MKFREKVTSYMKKQGMLQMGDHLLIGVSGGADSICLLQLLYDLAEVWKLSLTAVHVEHGIRGEESERDAEYVRQFCAHLQIPLELRHVNIPEIARREHLSEEEAGRMMRYRIFAEIGESVGAAKIAVAHHMDDQAETVLANLARGSGVLGGGAMRPVGASVIRPLLCVRRSEIEAFLREEGITFCTDATNEETKYTRNYLRKCILPEMTERVNARTVEHLAAFAEDMQKLQDYLRQQAEKLLEESSTLEKERITISLEPLRCCPEIIWEELLRCALERTGCGRKDITREHIRSMRELTALQSGRRIDLPGGWRAEKSFDCLVISKESGQELMLPEIRLLPRSLPSQIPLTEFVTDLGKKTEAFCEPELHLSLRRIEKDLPDAEKNISLKQYTKWMNYDKISDDLMLRTRRKGDYLILNGSGAKKKLKDYLIEEKVPRELRDRIPLIARGSEILWVIGGRMGEGGKLSNETENVLVLEVKDSVNMGGKKDE
ncbi:MAG: tRNA lysidine(34) synthetase TilS [Eubacteriales bacterium]|nr:tRNA lysidine(34) synthetase TilS [Eubacteriales bacterium]